MTCVVYRTRLKRACWIRFFFLLLTSLLPRQSCVQHAQVCPSRPTTKPGEDVLVGHESRSIHWKCSPTPYKSK